MKTISQYLNYRLKPSDCQMQLPEGGWVNATCEPFHYGVLTLGFWKVMKNRAKDAWQIMRGKAEAVKIK